MQGIREKRKKKKAKEKKQKKTAAKKKKKKKEKKTKKAAESAEKAAESAEKAKIARVAERAEKTEVYKAKKAESAEKAKTAEAAAKKAAIEKTAERAEKKEASKAKAAESEEKAVIANKGQSEAELARKIPWPRSVARKCNNNRHTTLENRKLACKRSQYPFLCNSIAQNPKNCDRDEKRIARHERIKRCMDRNKPFLKYCSNVELEPETKSGGWVISATCKTCRGEVSVKKSSVGLLGCYGMGLGYTFPMGWSFAQSNYKRFKSYSECKVVKKTKSMYLMCTQNRKKGRKVQYIDLAQIVGLTPSGKLKCYPKPKN